MSGNAPPPNDVDRLNQAFNLFRVWLNVIVPKQVGALRNLTDKLRK